MEDKKQIVLATAFRVVLDAINHATKYEDLKDIKWTLQTLLLAVERRQAALKSLKAE